MLLLQNKQTLCSNYLFKKKIFNYINNGRKKSIYEQSKPKLVNKT